MNGISIANQSLPSTLEDLSKFVLVGREQLVAVRAAIRAIDKVGIAQEVRNQKLKEGQEIAEAVLDAEVRIGELMREVPKASGGDRRSENFKNNTDVTFEKQKKQVISDMGFTPMQVSRFETLAAHPEAVERAKAEAREKDEIVTRSSVLDIVASEKDKPHVAYNSGNNEWYTPQKYIEMARTVLEYIDLDPASSKIANEIVKADNYFTAEENGLSQVWYGKVWMNPPYSKELIGEFTKKFTDEYEAGNIVEGIVLVNNATETAWFTNMIRSASAVVFPRGRILYYSPKKEIGAPLQGQAFIYFGWNADRFLEIFCSIGWGALIRG
jgi:DNA N-6-adenine-methyltransferase (Dam).